MPFRVLVVEDEAEIRAAVAYALRKAGFEVVEAPDGTTALAALRDGPPFDVAVLDVMLPDVSGFELCRRIRGRETDRGMGVVMLTARGEEFDRLMGFEVGADDYVVKPFSMRELGLRVAAVARRIRAAPSEETRTFGVLEVAPSAHRVAVEGREVTLTALEFRLLVTLLTRRGRVQTREVLLRDVWGISADVTTRTVDTHVKRLRQKLGPAGRYIETVRGVGYRFCEEPRS